MNRAFEIRLYPTNEQQKLLDITFGACRFVYNSVLGLRQSYFNDYGFKDKDLDIMDMLKGFNPWLNEIGSQSICQSLNDLNKAYKNWFNSLSKKTKQKSKAPKFKKKNNKQSYRDCMMKKNIFELLDIQNRKITVPKIGKITYRCGYEFGKYGRTYIKVGSFYPSSKLCHCCGYKNTTLTLSDREWECPNCYTLLDRDKNAALNILDKGLKIFNKTGQELPVEPIETENMSSLE